MANALAQVVAVTALNLKTLGERRGAALTTVFGVAGVVAVFVGVLSIGAGFRASMEAGGRDDVAMVMRSGNDSEMMSGLRRDSTDLIKLAPGVLRDGEGPVASAELFVVVGINKRSTDTPANVPLRGVQAKALQVRGSVKIVEGRMFAAGRNEVIVGRAASHEFVGLELGKTSRWGQNDWTVVGIFEDNGSVVESEVWCDAAVLQPAYQRGDVFQSVRAKLVSANDFQAFKDAITKDPRLDVMVQRESEYFAGQSQVLAQIITGLGSIIALMMGFGAVFGALNTMYSAVASRTREIATLRAIGFESLPVVISVLVEALVLALVGGVLGAVGAYFAFDGFQAATLNFSTFSQVAFRFAVTPKLLMVGIAYALIMGTIGGLFPAIRAARMPVTAALREL